MNDWQAKVTEFMVAMGQTVPHPGLAPAIRDADLRASLIAEEAVETINALGLGVSIEHWQQTNPEGNLVDLIDGLCDLLYVTIGTAVSAGIDLDPFFDEVHRSNMSKVGGAVREDGKRLKPRGWRPPDIEGRLKEIIAASGTIQTPSTLED